MKRDMYTWLKEVQGETVKNPMPILSFPAIQLLGISVKELISDSDLQAKGMKAVADRVVSLASVSLMDLSVEAECFGSTIRVSDDEVPTVVGSLVSTMEEAQALPVPPVRPRANRSALVMSSPRSAAVSSSSNVAPARRRASSSTAGFIPSTPSLPSLPGERLRRSLPWMSGI